MIGVSCTVSGLMCMGGFCRGPVDSGMSACGGLNLACCPGANPCPAEYVCNAGLCRTPTTCGGATQACCGGNCIRGYICTAGTCQGMSMEDAGMTGGKCGGPMDACCTTGVPCPFSTCVGGFCTIPTTCGNIGQTCCGGAGGNCFNGACTSGTCR